MFPFFLDFDLKTTVHRTRDELVRFGQEVVLPCVLEHYLEGSFSQTRLLVCTAQEPKITDVFSCPECRAPVDEFWQRCEACGMDRGDQEATRTRFYKCSVHYRFQNEQTLVDGPPHQGPETRFPVVTSNEAVDIYSRIFTAALSSRYRDWGSHGDWKEWLDVAPVKSTPPSLRVLGTVKSVKCAACCGKRELMECCILCGGSGKVVDDRPYVVVASIDASGTDHGPIGDMETMIHATSIRVTGDPSPGCRALDASIPRLVATDEDVARARTLLRNVNHSDDTSRFETLSRTDKRRYQLTPVQATKTKRNYVEVDTPRIWEAAEAVVRSSFGGVYADVVVTKVLRSSKGFCVNVDGRGSTYCANRGPSNGQARGPGPHASSHVYFILHADRGIRQRCFSQKIGACGGSCRAWEGTCFSPIDLSMVYKLWPKKRAEATAASFDGFLNQSDPLAVAVGRISQCIDNSLAQDEAQLDTIRMMECVSRLVRTQAGQRCQGMLLEDNTPAMLKLLGNE